MRSITEIEKSLADNPEIRKLAMDIAQFMFTESQENLTKPMPWGDKSYKSERKPSVISDEATLLISGEPPYWEGKNRIAFRYDAPHAVPVEYGSPPHPVSGKRLIGWVNRKLGKKGKKGVRIAYAIATKIRKEGIDPHPFIRPSISATETKFKLVRIRMES